MWRARRVDALFVAGPAPESARSASTGPGTWVVRVRLQQHGRRPCRWRNRRGWGRCGRRRSRSGSHGSGGGSGCSCGGCGVRRSEVGVGCAHPLLLFRMAHLCSLRVPPIFPRVCCIIACSLLLEQGNERVVVAPGRAVGRQRRRRRSAQGRRGCSRTRRGGSNTIGSRCSSGDCTIGFHGCSEWFGAG